MLNGNEKEFYSIICRALSKNDNLSKKGEFFYRVPVNIVNKLRKDGYCVKIIDPLNIPDMDNGVSYHFIFVHYR